MRYISLFAGIGGFDLALNRLEHTCVWASEWDKYAAEIYNKNFKETQERAWESHSQGVRSGKDTGNYEGDKGLGSSGTTNQQHTNGSTARQHGIDTRDIRTVPTSEIPDHDLLVGGFPCQAFSIAGKRRGFDDTRGTLFFEIARILKDKQPKLFILENVKGLLSHDGGNTFKTIISTLTELGYDLQWQVLNSKNFGVPQNRERVFIVGHLRGERRPEVFPIGENDSPANEGFEGGIQHVAGTLKQRDYASWRGNFIRQLNNPTHSNDRVYGDGGVSPSLNTMQGGRRQPKIAIPVLTPDRIEKRQNGRRFKENGEESFTLTGQDKHGVSDGVRIRRLTPLECERLQGFPDGWTEGVSDTQRYKCLGNAVTVNVVEEIAKRL